MRNARYAVKNLEFKNYIKYDKDIMKLITVFNIRFTESDTNEKIFEIFSSQFTVVIETAPENM